MASIPLRDNACQHSNKLLLTAPFTFASIVIKRGHGDFLEQPIYIADANLFFSNVLNAERTTIRLVVVCKTYDFFYCLLFFENLLRLSVKLQLVVLLEKHETYRYEKGEVVVLASYCMLHKTEKCASIDSCQNTKLNISSAMPRVKTRLDN